jgi:hypothetical protein
LVVANARPFWYILKVSGDKPLSVRVKVTDLNLRKSKSLSLHLRKIIMNSPKEKAPNYSDELIAQILADYDGGKGMSAKDIGVKYNRATRSIVGKLVNLGVYVKAEVAPKEHVDNGPSKKEYLEVLKGLGFSDPALDGLKNATKPALAELIERVQDKAVA